MNSQTKFTTNYVRQSWLDIFQQKGYYLLEPASLIPQNDLSLLWINSGVATLIFKNIQKSDWLSYAIFYA